MERQILSQSQWRTYFEVVEETAMRAKSHGTFAECLDQGLKRPLQQVLTKYEQKRKELCEEVVELRKDLEKAEAESQRAAKNVN